MEPDKVQTAISLWPIAVGFVVFIAWLVRLEAKVLYLERDLIRSAKESAKKEASMSTEMKEVNSKLTEALKSLAKIEGRLESQNRNDQ